MRDYVRPGAVLMVTLLAVVRSAPATDPEVTNPRVLSIDYDPLLESQGGVRLHTWAGWNNPSLLTLWYVNDFDSATHNLLKFRVTRDVKTDVYPLKADGFRYTDATYIAAAQSGGWHQPDGVDYQTIARNYDLARKIDSGEIDEVFVHGAPYFGYWESTMAGYGGYWCNSPPQQRIACSKIFVMMGFNYERGVAEMLHSCGHRAESIMSHTYGYWDITQARHDWERFTLNAGQSAPLTPACGSVHYPPNGFADYDYANTTLVSSTAEDWLVNFPDLTGATTMVNRETWGGPDYHRNFMKWWYAHMPHVGGRNNHDGFNYLNNWYPYIFDLNRYPEAGGDHGPGGTPPVATPNISTPVRVTTRLNDDWAPKVNDSGRVVWHGSDGNDFEIFSANRDGSDLVQITSNILIDEDAQINASGRIVWQQFDGQDFEIFSANADGTDVVQITSNAVNDWHPQINDSGRIVWDGYDGGDYEIYTAMSDGSGLTAVTSNGSSTGYPREDVWPQINNADRIVWFGYDGSNWEIFSADADGAGLVNVSNDSREDVYPQLNDAGRVVWFRWYSDTNTEICSADATGGPVVRVTNNVYHDWHPQISATGKIVWTARPLANWEIFSAAADGTQVTQITNNDTHDQYPQIDDGDRIVWQGFDGNDWEIYGLDGGTLYQVTDNSYDDRAPVLSNAVAVWHAESEVDSAGMDSTEIFSAPLGQNFDDVDMDGLPDEWEMMQFGDLGHGPGDDEEPDGLTNDLEYAHGTNPLDPDSDNDGLNDGDEVLVYLTDPLDADSDDDGLNDGDEVSAGTDPHLSDTDEDGIPDGWEVDHGLDPLVDDAGADPDNDGATNGEEYDAGSDPMAPWSIPVPPPAGTALDFDGVDDYVSLGDVAVSGNQLTVEAWVKPQAVASARILEKLEDYGVQFTAGNVVRFMTKYGFTWDTLDGQSSNAVDTWVHIACVLDGATKWIYVNGEPDGQRSYSQNVKVTTNPLIMGAASPGGTSGNIDAVIDEVRVWNVARTQQEIQAAMNTALTGTETGLVGYWTLDDGSGQSASDSAGSNHGQLGSSAAVDAADPVWIDSPIAVPPDTGIGPDIAAVAYPDPVGYAAPITVTVDISDAATGDDGVSAATLYYDYAWPYNASSVAGVGPGGNGDGTWTFTIPAQGQGQVGQVLAFFVRADDGQGTPTFDSNGGELYSIAIGVPADVNGDGKVDLGDFDGMDTCLTGPDGAPSSGCETFDFEADGDVDLADFSFLQGAFTG